MKIMARQELPPSGEQSEPQEGVETKLSTHEQDLADITAMISDAFTNTGVGAAEHLLTELTLLISPQEADALRADLVRMQRVREQEKSETTEKPPASQLVLSLEQAQQLLALATIARRNAHTLLSQVLEEEPYREEAPLSNPQRNAASLAHLTEQGERTAQKLINIHSTEPERITELAQQILSFAAQSEYYAANISADAETIAMKLAIAKSALESGMNVLDVLNDPELGPKKPSKFAHLLSRKGEEPKEPPPKPPSKFAHLLRQDRDITLDAFGSPIQSDLERDVERVTEIRDYYKDNERREQVNRKKEVKRMTEKGEFEGDPELARLWVEEGRYLAHELAGMDPQDRDKAEIPGHLTPIFERIIEEVDWLLRYDEYDKQKEELETEISARYTEAKMAYQKLDEPLDQDAIDHLTSTYLIPLKDLLKKMDTLYDTIMGTTQRKQSFLQPRSQMIPEVKETASGTPASQWVQAFDSIGISQKTLRNPALFSEMLKIASQEAEKRREQKRANIQAARKIQYEASQRVQKREISATEGLREITQAQQVLEQEKEKPFETD